MVRPLYHIDWAKVDELMLCGCTGTEIAGYFGMHPDTFYKRVEKEKKVGFSAYLQEKHSKGEALLRAQQFKKALGLTDKGDNTLLVWLGKTRLKQKEQEDQGVSKNIEDKFDSLMDVMKKNQDLSAVEISSKADMRS